MLQFITNKCCIPGKVENWLIIMDLDGVGFSEIPVTAMRKILGRVQNHFRGRANRCYILNAGWVIQTSWYMFSGMLEPTSAAKLQLLGTDYKEVLVELIGKEKLEERFGGTQPNKTSQFFPPDLSEPD